MTDRGGPEFNRRNGNAQYSRGTQDSSHRAMQSKAVPAKGNRATQPQKVDYRPANAELSQYSRNNPNSPYGGKRKMSTKKKVALSVVGVLAIVLVGVGIAAALYVNSLNQAMSFSDKEEEMELREALAPVESAEDPFYMLLLGSDARSGEEASRSDVMILLRVDPSNGKLTMVSVPRDTKVEIEGYGTQKINAAYAYGGASLAVETVSKFAGVPISHYAEIHFEELEQAVDSLGGVTVDVPEAIYDDQLNASLSAGVQTLNGEQALVFARSRAYADGDFTRTSNQRILLTAIMKQVLALPAVELPGAVQTLAQCATTDYSVTDAVALAQQFQSAGDLTMYSGMVPSSTATIDGVSYVLTDEAAWAETMKIVNAGDDPAPYLEGLAAAAAQQGEQAE